MNWPKLWYRNKRDSAIGFAIAMILASFVAWVPVREAPWYWKVGMYLLMLYAWVVKPYLPSWFFDVKG